MWGKMDENLKSSGEGISQFKEAQSINMDEWMFISAPCVVNE